MASCKFSWTFYGTHKHLLHSGIIPFTMVLFLPFLRRNKCSSWSSLVTHEVQNPLLFPGPESLFNLLVTNRPSSAPEKPNCVVVDVSAVAVDDTPLKSPLCTFSSGSHVTWKIIHEIRTWFKSSRIRIHQFKEVVPFLLSILGTTKFTARSLDRGFESHQKMNH